MIAQSFICALLFNTVNKAQVFAGRFRGSYFDINYKPAKATVQCYSCMSTLYENLWSEFGLQMIYKKPESFTFYCDRDHFNSRQVMSKPCADYCVTIENENVIFNIFRKTYMRGCISDLINYNLTTISYLTNRQRCLSVPIKYLFMKNFETAQHQTLRICVCFEGLCNGTTITSGRSFATIVLFALATHWFTARQLQSEA